jgi:hypothetical protein
MSRTPRAWIPNLGRPLTILVVAGFAASALAACGGADSGSGGSGSAAATSAAIASAMAGSEAATSGASTPAPTASSDGDSSQNEFTDAQACTWVKQEVAALRKVSSPDLAQVTILTSLSNFFDKHGGFDDEIKQGGEMDAATQRACPTQHDALLKKANLKNLSDLP